MKYALFFSGGRDSIALLHFWRDKWDETLVIWINTQAAYPETIELMKRIKRVVPNFLEIKTNQPKDIEENGFPSDIVPTSFTTIGKSVTGNTGIKIRSPFECCNNNLWQPSANAIQLLGIKHVVRGQRNSEGRTSPIRNGFIDNKGVMYHFPLEEWTDQEVKDYLIANGLDVPFYYGLGEETSRDCWTCTGYLDEQITRIKNLPEEQRNVVIGRLQQIRIAVEHDSKALKTLTKE